MEERNWKYKITSRTGLVVAAVMLALFGGVTFWLYTVHNGAFILVGCIATLTAIAFLLSVYSALFFKVFVDKDGLYFQTAPGNGRYYRYAEICDMWLSSGRETNARQSTYCNFETVEGKRLRFTGKTEAGFVVIPTILSLLMVVVTVMMLLAWNLPPILIAIPIIFELVTLAQILSLGLFYKVQIQKDGFYYRTNPFDGRYYRYSDILDCRLVESQRQYGSRYNRGRIRKTYYFYDLKFIDSSHQTHRLPYNKSLYEGEIDELVARIERAREDGE